MRRTALIVLTVIVAATIFGIVLTQRLIRTWHPEQTSSASGPSAITSGAGLTVQFSDRPVAVPAVAITDVDGRPVKLEALAGKVVLVNFWATWCGPCREEIPALIALQQYYGQQLVILGLSIDTRPVA